MSGPKSRVASRLRQRITLQQQAQSADGAGGFTRSWEDVASVWAEMTPVASSERLEDGQLHSIVRHRFLLRYRDAVTHAMRISYDGRVFNILSVVNSGERDALLEILAEEGVAT